MKKGFLKFEYYLTRLEALIEQSGASTNRAEFLYSNDARTLLFMLEGLSRVYGYIYNDKLFRKLREHFKLLEDALGEIDYFDSFTKQFKANPKTPITVTAYLRTRMQDKKIAFLQLLVNEKWIGKKTGRLRKIRRKLVKFNWRSEKFEIRGLESYYIDSIEETKVLALESSKGFTELEAEVHEMRRQLRWLSIYPRAMQGSVQLHDSPVNAVGIEKYLVPEIINSAFNKMPEPDGNQYLLLHDKNNFFALSWMISELGKLKDEGLTLMALSEALEVTEEKDKAWADSLACEMLQLQPDALDNILKKATDITIPYFKGEYLEKLIFGITEKV